jgi:hypothetical protein
MYVSDLRHFLDLPAAVPGPARRMAERLTMSVRAATAGDAGVEWGSAGLHDQLMPEVHLEAPDLVAYRPAHG